MELFTVRRGDVNTYYTPQHFRSSVTSGGIRRSDLIYDHASRQFLPAGSFANLEPYLPPKGLGEIIEDLIAGVVVGALVVGAGLGTAALLEDIFSPPPAPKPRRRSPNREPLEQWKKDIVRLRDGEICSYCGIHDPRGHVDHKTSRANGGSNLLRNLTWACVRCNCSKGGMNARNFRRLTGYYT